MPLTTGARVIFAWGAGEDGQLGLEGAELREDWHIGIPTAVTSGEPSVCSAPACVQLVAGSRHSLAIDATGALFCWGWNQKATLGLGHLQPVKVMARVAVPGEVTQAALGGWHGLALTSDARVFAWGGNENFQCEPVEASAASGEAAKVVPVPRQIMCHLRARQVAAGAMHSLLLTEEGELYTWGQPLTNWMLTADNNTYAKAREPQRVEGAAGIVAIACGAFHNMALTAAGRVLTWGHSDYGQLGLGSTTHFATPNVESLDSAGVVALAAGGWHSAVLTSSGSVFIWGRGEYGRLGLGENWKDRLSPTELPTGGARIVQVHCGGTHSLAVTEGGELLSFGRPTLGRLGRSSATNPNVPLPVELPPPGDGLAWAVEAAAAGGRHSFAVARAVPSAAAAAAAAAAGGVQLRVPRTP